MTSAKLFISFWNICLENLPVGSFTHRFVPTQEAKELIEEARQADTLLCLSKDDLLAPYRQRELENHQQLCRVLTEEFAIPMALDDFLSTTGEGKTEVQHILPLNVARIEGESRLLVVTCNYMLGELLERTSEKLPPFAVALDSVKFHLIEPT